MRAMDEETKNLQSTIKAVSQEVGGVKREVQGACDRIDKGFTNMEQAINKEVGKVSLQFRAVERRLETLEQSQAGVRTDLQTLEKSQGGFLAQLTAFLARMKGGVTTQPANQAGRDPNV